MNFFEKYKWLLPSLAFSIALTLVRIAYTGYSLYFWMNWNLFLAIIPLYISYKARTTNKRSHRWLLGVLWLLFFPNAIYMVTDLFHLSPTQDIPLWYDLLLLFSMALNGIILGMLSLNNIEQAISTMLKKKVMHITTFSLLFLCGYGIYLGRYERWNSWDIVTQPHLLLSSIVQHVIHPFNNLEVWAISFSFSIWMYLLYQYMNRLKQYIHS